MALSTVILNIEKRLRISKYYLNYLNCQYRTISIGSNNYSSNDYILSSKFPNVEQIKGITVPELLWSSFQKEDWKKSIAFECGTTGSKLTHETVFKNCKSFAAALLQSALQPRDAVAIVLPNNIHYCSIVLGIMEAGLIPSPVNPAYLADEILRQLKHSEAKCVVTIPEFVPVMFKIKELYPDLKSVIVVGEAQDGCHTYGEMIKVDPRNAPLVKGSDIDTTQEIALLPYSSGTTGVPKGVCLTHSNIVTHMAQMLTPNCVTVNRDDRFIGLLPMFHAYGFLTYVVIGPLCGVHTMCLPRFDPVTYLQAVRNHKPTILHLVTPLLLHLSNNPEYGRKEFETIHSIIGAAAPIGPWLVNQLLDKAGKYFFFQEAYGLTEATAGITILSPDTKNTKTGSSGRLFPGTIAKVVASDGSGRSLGPNENGEICMKGPQMMKGYWRNEAATKQMIDSDGWLHTGDIGYYDKEEYVYIVDRLKELIKVKGYQVAPAELEEILRQHPNVAEAAVIGVPDAESGELPRAYVVRKNNEVKEEDIHAFLKDKLSHHKQLKGGIEFVEAVPKAPSGKLLRRLLKVEYFQKHGIPLP